MRKFNITVNGKSYEVEVEEIGGGSFTPVSEPAQQTPAPAPAQKAATPSKPKQAAPSAGSVVVKAPMPGTILSVNVKPGDSVTKGKLLCVLEAMKMENEILAPSDGKISSVYASKGSSVNTEDILIVIA